MAVVKAYTTEAKVAAFLNTTITSGEADDAINAAVDMIDKITDRNFIAESTASVRRYNGNDSDNLLIDDCVEITEVSLGLDPYGDSTETLTADVSNGYYKVPRDFSAQSKPITELHLRGRVWLRGLGNHAITAKWGYSVNVPSAIEFAATILAAGIYNYNRGGGSGSIKSEKIGNYAVTYENSEGWDEYNKALAALAGYKKFAL